MMTNVGTFWKHKERGTVYEITAEGVSLQCSSYHDIEALFEGEKMFIYRDIETGAQYCRIEDEFLDGRFEQVDDPRIVKKSA